MANGKTHILVGAAVGLGVALIDNNKHSTSHNPFTAIAVGGDFLEPATNPHHRQFCHSVLTAGVVSFGLFEAMKWNANSTLEKITRGVVLIAGFSYLSHLVLDATTPRSLPLIGKF
ncbi:MAG: metal-dependent hydrolase [Colwellia sp.]|jgi:Predicted membrane-bound metal-dependent hydrolase (DUF457).